MSSEFVGLRARYFVVPALALVALAATWTSKPGSLLLLVLGLTLGLTVFVAVHHAEVVALRVGEPFGSLILALSVTIIEVGMIVVLMLSAPDSTANLARDTVFAAVMLTTNGIVGLSLLIKALVRRQEAVFNAYGTIGALSTLAALSTLSLVLPSVTTSAPGPTFTVTQLLFAAVVSLLLYLTFVAMQTVRHRDYFLPPSRLDDPHLDETHAVPPSSRQAGLSLLGLLAALVAIVGLAKVMSPPVQALVDELGMPQMVVAIAIAAVVLLPESISAFKAARYGRTQTSLNLAYGSALASIGLTIPTIAVLSIVFGYAVNLGLNTAEIVLMTLTFFVSALTVVLGRATLLQATIHLSILGAFVLFSALP